jgi:hypothetical protein
MADENENMPDTGVEVLHDPVADWVAERSAELQGESVLESESPGDPDTEVQEEVKSETPAPESEKPAEEPFTQAMRSLLEQRDAFNREKAKWLEEKTAQDARNAEIESQAQALSEAARLLEISPAALYEKLGIPKEKLPDIARKTYYEYLEDDAPDEYKATRANTHLYKELTELKQLVQEQQKSLQVQAQSREVAAYQSELVQHVSSVSEDTDPVLHKLTEVYGPDRVASTMYDLAVYAARQPGATAVLSPSEVAELLTEQYKPLLGTTEKPAPEKNMGKKQSSN